MFGYATDETEECMPLTVVLAHRLNAKIAELRRSGEFWWARPDSKTQVNHRLFTFQWILNTKIIFHDVKLNNLRLFATLDWTMMQTFIWFHPPFLEFWFKSLFQCNRFQLQLVFPLFSSGHLRILIWQRRMHTKTCSYCSRVTSTFGKNHIGKLT